ncbi:peptidase M23 [Salinisphaera sp. PC39]|uniref:M23 family metallopeptidase n=1 Tax=Salinisphaera sp. PC39 TaxID=1304156 RepID=UPI00333F4233
MLRIVSAIAVLAIAAAAAAGERVEFSGENTQGGLMVGHAPAGAEVTVDGRAVSVSPDGLFAFGIGRDAEGPVTVAVAAGGEVTRHRLEVRQREYDVQRIDGLPPSKVSPSAEDLARIRDEQALINRARGRDLARSGFAQEWLWPVTGIITGVYGSQRVLNGKPRRPHYGVDVAADKGTPVRAPAAGIVALAHPDMYFSGHTVILDHGHGVTSTLIHMSEMHVEAGDEVARGEVIGAVGATGRATGPHLHWGVNWFDTRLDPALLVPPMSELVD